jgi:hypothetical protein
VTPHCPDVTSYVSMESFFKRLIADNSRRHKAFSYRALAKFLEWPFSLVSDVINGRKHLALTRSLEFANRFSLDVEQTDHLVLLSLKGHSHPLVRQYAKDRLVKSINISEDDLKNMETEAEGKIEID